jgi:uncharacterized membrane protein
MEPIIPVLAIAALFLLVVVPILAIAAFVRAGHVRDKIESLLSSYNNRFYQLEQRLGRIEKALAGATVTAPEAESKPQPVPAAPPVAPLVPVVPAAPRPEPPRVAAPLTPATKPPLSAPASTPPLSSLTPPRGPEKEPADVGLEALVAGRWMNYVGILALLIGVGFFLKYAFDNNWIGPRGRVGIGLLAGSALYPFSHRLLDKGYRYFSEGIAGLGAAILYLSLWAGWHYYLIFSQTSAFVMMIAVTAATTVVAVGRNSERISVLALVGGIITPEIVSTGQNHEVVLFTYMTVLGVGMVALARIRDWQTLPPIQFVASLVYFWGWYQEFYRRDELAVTILFATVFFLLFAALPVVRSWREGQLPNLEVMIVLVNSLAYVIALRVMLWPEYRWALTVAMLAVAGAHLAAERALPQKSVAGTTVARVLFAGLALTFVTLTIPIRLDGRWITIGWAIEGAILIWSGLRIHIGALRGAGFALFVIVLARVLLLPLPAKQFLFNERFATYAVCVACLVAACIFARREGVELGKQESVAFLVAAIAANIYSLAALSLEIWDVFGRTPSLGIDRGLAQELGLSLLWLVYALALLVAGVWKKSAVLRWQALILLGVVIGKVFIFDLSFLERFYRIVSFMLLGLVLLLISFYYQRYWASREDEKKA